MAKKIGFPNRACPGCGAAIHIKTRQHECGWVAEGQATTPTATVKPVGRPRKLAAAKAPSTSAGGITIQDLSAVKALVDRMGAEKVQRLAQVLAK